jgi:NAD(P)-dependent dehydrogenase (short-subunit alcohol dehydrogenase family)
MVLVVTGSTRGIGKAIVDRFAHSASTIFLLLEIPISWRLRQKI